MRVDGGHLSSGGTGWWLDEWMDGDHLVFYCLHTFSDQISYDRRMVVGSEISLQ